MEDKPIARERTFSDLGSEDYLYRDVKCPRVNYYSSKELKQDFLGREVKDIMKLLADQLYKDMDPFQQVTKQWRAWQCNVLYNHIVWSVLSLSEKQVLESHYRQKDNMPPMLPKKEGEFYYNNVAPLNPQNDAAFYYHNVDWAVVDLFTRLEEDVAWATIAAMDFPGGVPTRIFVVSKCRSITNRVQELYLLWKPWPAEASSIGGATYRLTCPGGRTRVKEQKFLLDNDKQWSTGNQAHGFVTLTALRGGQLEVEKLVQACADMMALSQLEDEDIVRKIMKRHYHTVHHLLSSDDFKALVERRLEDKLIIVKGLQRS